jgi:hypothetical protein
LFEPVPENGDRLRGKRCGTLLAPLASTAYVSNLFKTDVFAPQMDEFRNTESGLDDCEQDRMVAAPDPRVTIGSFE